MEPIKINVEVSLSEATLAILERLAGQASPAGVATAPVSAAKAEEQKPAEVKPEAPQVATDDLPVADEELRAAVKAAKDATSAADVKALFAEFGIKTSVDCPDDKRPALLAKLNNLAKAA